MTLTLRLQARSWNDACVAVARTFSLHRSNPHGPFGACLSGCRGNDPNDVAVLITQEKKLAVRDCWFNCVHDCSTVAEGSVVVIHDRELTQC